MGCLQGVQSSGLEVEIDKSQHKAKNQVLASPTTSGLEPIHLDENALFDKSVQEIRFVTKLNDIEALSKKEIIKQSEAISRHAIAKIMEYNQDLKAEKQVSLEENLLIDINS